MLSPGRDYDDDDSHLCIKCNATIIGLENYVKHRKEGCRKKYQTTMKNSKVALASLEPLEPTYNLGADVFFQSLELQSSVKKPSVSQLTPIPIASKPNQILDRRKSSLVVASSSRDLPTMSPLETNLRGEDWIGGHSLRIGNSEADNQTKLINAVASISGAVKKELLPRSSYAIAYNDYKDESDGTSEESEEEDDDEPDNAWKPPPPHHTGGKWRPGSPDQEEWEKDEPEHTGGKWKPVLSQDSIEHADDYDAPPPGHTKGKWVPGAQEHKTQIMQTTIQTKSSVQYWCGPCNRRLGSRAIYEKHLTSNLHMRKIMPENDLEYSGHMESRLDDKRTIKPSQYTNDSIYQVQKKRKRSARKKDRPEVKRRNRKPYYTECNACKSRVRVHLMGKHLISHYHFRKASGVRSEVYRQLILDNIEAIVHQSPFQCSPCKFYTNWLSNMMQHWYSEDHIKVVSLIDGRYWCSFCKYECESSEDMLQHMSGEDHAEVLALVNRSMPIIIRKKTVFKCPTCSKEFRYNIEMKKHCHKTGHILADTATDDYQEVHNCKHCESKFRSSLALASHLKTKHKHKHYVCVSCSMSFNTNLEAKLHRHTPEHRIRRKEIQIEKGLSTKDLTRKCPHCQDKEVVLKNILELKEHIRVEHPNIRKTCPKCGMSFILSQEVTCHIRRNECDFQHVSSSNASTLWRCSQCFFTTDSQAECFFHEILHTDPSVEVRTVDGKEKTVQKYPCPFCSALFRKSSLRHHIRQHTFERPYICTICGANFTRQSTLDNHSKVEHGSAGGSADRAAGGTLNKSEDVRCSTCDKKFLNKDSLTKHNAVPCTKIREYRCPHEKCTFVASTNTLLNRHRKLHGEKLKTHECICCDFKSDQASQLKRHMICHKGTKPFKCPHCSFACGSWENLRKHVISSVKHKGLFLYNCKECSGAYQTNKATELRAHLVSEHSATYNSKNVIETVKAYLLKED